MVVVLGAVVTCPPVVALVGQPGAAAIIPALGASQGITSAGAAVMAVGEGAVVGAGVVGGGSGSAGIALATFVGPIGWAVVGCKENNNQHGKSGYTWDCWKPIIRDTSTVASDGMTLRCLATHPNIQSMSFEQGELLVENIFGEHFRLTPVNIEGSLAFHASTLSL
ncbi:hypothetical protein COCCADRAFT_31365 [Bipolaris zeicola 26-R-13]|uniref:Uncharacterized protein n=1 Tax=Cochliobolus carbonum (strain 26-R-13) TaxID=930089 RepID=W6XIY1_COCC2|nr:uncharacterized protein COCCADRAFT_31365 [Bipolaris zeicola 26-R-13]EUC27047.1 hypothetical protein COCCADRAFT_31365 [Bipolaris zeicola 26-R-13]